jgi:hypothetical protein
MIINEYVKTTMHPKTYRHYEKLGYKGDLYDIIYVLSLDLPLNSRVRVNVECDICKNKTNIIYNNYNRQISRQNYYCCHPCSFEKNKKTNYDKFGCEYSFQSSIVKLKIKSTLMDRYGVDHPTKNREIFEKAQSTAYKTFRYKDGEIKYQGSYELNFIEYCIDKKIIFGNGHTIDYVMNDKKRKYHSDFYLPDYNLICEVKSLYTYNDDYDENILKMEYTIKSGYNFLFIIDKNYNELEEKIKSKIWNKN